MPEFTEEQKYTLKRIKDIAVRELERALADLPGGPGALPDRAEEAFQSCMERARSHICPLSPERGQEEDHWTHDRLAEIANVLNPIFDEHFRPSKPEPKRGFMNFELLLQDIAPGARLTPGMRKLQKQLEKNLARRLALAQAHTAGKTTLNDWIEEKCSSEDDERAIRNLIVREKEKQDAVRLGVGAMPKAPKIPKDLIRMEEAVKIFDIHKGTLSKAVGSKRIWSLRKRVKGRLAVLVSKSDVQRLEREIGNRNEVRRLRRVSSDEAVARLARKIRGD